MTNPAESLLFAMIALFCWTFLVMLRNVQVRLRAVMDRQLTNAYFELFAGAEPPEAVVKTANHLRNLMEFPPLFYAATLAILFAGKADEPFAILAWCYVALRIGHSLVHLTINRVPARFTFFFLSNLVLLAMWLRLGAFL